MTYGMRILLQEWAARALLMGSLIALWQSLLALYAVYASLTGDAGATALAELARSGMFLVGSIALAYSATGLSISRMDS